MNLNKNYNNSESRYQDRIVAFLDILGWRSFVTKSLGSAKENEKLWILLQDIQHHFNVLTDPCYGVPESDIEVRKMVSNPSARQEEDGWPKGMQYAQFSDSIIISAELTPLSIGAFFLQIIRYTKRLFNAGILLRGGICIGPMFHSRNIGYGPVLTKAYDLESQLARFPRIIIDRACEDYKMIDMHGRNKRKIKESLAIKRDRDGYCFINFLTGEDLILKQLDTQLIKFIGHSIEIDALQDIFEPARIIITQGINKFSHEPKTLEKYEWLAKYFNDCREDYYKNTINPITIT